MSFEFVGIELELRGEEAVYSDLQKIDRLLNSLGGKKKVDAGFQDLKRDILAARGELEKFQRARQKYLDEGGKGNAFLKEIQEARYRLKDLLQTQREVTLATRQMGDTFKQTFNRMSSGLTHAGSKMQTLGNALQKLTSPFERFTTGLIMGAGYKALGKFTEGLSNGFNRYDTMKKYPKIMAAFGYSAEESAKSIDMLDKSVRGLPTGLDEMVDLTQRFTATTGNLQRGTKLAIATNNAFLASMSTDTQRYQGMMQLQDVLGGKDLNSREWNSLVSSMTPAIVKMGESMGYTNKNMGEFIQTIRDGKMDNQEFIDQLIKIGNEGGVLEKMAKESKDTWQALFANIGNAASRMTAGTIQALDEVSKAITGKDVNLFLAESFIPSIDNATASVKEWIKAHPEEIKEFFKDLSGIDFKGFVKGLAEGMGEMAKAVQAFAKFASGKDLSNIGKMMIRLNMAGKFFTIFGGLVKGLSHPLAAIGALIVRGGRSFKSGGFMGMLGDLIAGESLSSLGEATKKIDTATPTMGKLGTGLSKFFRGWAQIAAMIGGSALVGAVSFKAFKSAFKDISEIGDIIADTDWDYATKGLIGIGGFLTAFIGLGRLLGGKGGLKTLAGGSILAGLTVIFSGAFWADMAMIKRGLKAMNDAVGYVNSIIDQVNSIKDIGGFNTNKLDNAIQAFNKITRLFSGEAEASNEGVPAYSQYGSPTRTFKHYKEPLREFKKKYVESLKSMKDALTYMEDISGLLDKVNGLEFSTDNIQDISDRMNTALQSIGGMVQKIPEVFKDKKTETTSTILKNTIENVKTTFDFITGKGGLFSQIKALNKKIAELIKNGEFDTLETNMDTLSTALSGIWNKLDFTKTEEGFNPDAQFGGGGFAKSGGTAQLQNPTQIILTQIQNLSAAMLEIENIITSIGAITKSLKKVNISEDGTFAFTQDLQRMVSQLKAAFNSEEILALETQVTTFKNAIDNLKASLESIGSMGEGGGINVDITIVPTITGDKETIDKLKKAHDGIKKQRDAIAKLSKSINLRFPISVSLPGLNAALIEMNSAASKLRAARANLQSAQGGLGSISGSGGGGMTVAEQAKGGMIYRARGGGVPKRRGTDTVHAMLTPGEFVQNKRAVNLFGIDFMRKVNNLDMRGAMHELMTRAGNMANVSRGTVINNYYNNNQRVTQNINNPSPTFAVNSASRFAGAFK